MNAKEIKLFVGGVALALMGYLLIDVSFFPGLFLASVGAMIVSWYWGSVLALLTSLIQRKLSPQMHASLTGAREPQIAPIANDQMATGKRPTGKNFSAILTQSDSIIVSQESIRGDDAISVVQSNIEFLNALFGQHVYMTEVSRDALMSYYVDYYLAQVNNGGFSQFVYNGRWSPIIVSSVREGLAAIGATQNLALFEEVFRQVTLLGEAGLKAYLNGEYGGINPVRDELNTHNDQFFELQKTEELTLLNAMWLRAHPRLHALPQSDMRTEVERRAAAVPDHERRLAEARSNEPRYTKLIRALCKHAGHELRKVTAGDQLHVHEGTRTMAWHFITDKGHHYMVEAGGKAMMFHGANKTLIAQIVTS